MEHNHSHKKHEFFYICGHASMILDENNNATQYNMPDSIIYTFAPPGASCSLPPDTIEQLREKLYETRSRYNNSETFWKQILKAEFNIRGINYCSEKWVNHFAKQEGYSPTKACNKQKNAILQKTFTFHDDEHQLPFGIWNLKTNKNYLQYIDEEQHDLYSICTFLKHLFPDKIINILDITCNSPLLFDMSGYEESKRLQRRLARSAIIASTSNQFHRKNKSKRKGRTRSRSKRKGRSRSRSRSRSRRSRTSQNSVSTA